MSRGEGRLQRKIISLVGKARLRGDGSLTRRDLENSLSREGYRSDNVLRALRGLARAGMVEFREARFASNSVVGPPKPLFFSDEEIIAILSEPGWRQAPNATHRKYAPNRPRGGEKPTRVSEGIAAPRVKASPAFGRAAWVTEEGGNAV